MDNEEVIKAVTDVFGYTIEQLRSKSRKRGVVYARVALIVILRGMGLSLRKTGILVGRHKSTIYGHEHITFDVLIEQDKDFMEKYNKVVNLLIKP